ncbi:hypothetical protein J6590_099790 [Homalodisca vitripennis]|nr:hypothetical protein J6590_099790 [Homalodisca vitripennis]
MIAGDAVGVMAPFYVNYKFERFVVPRQKTTLLLHGITGQNQDWYKLLMLAILTHQKGTTVVIGDNLSSHFNLEYVRRMQFTFCSYLTWRIFALCKEPGETSDFNLKASRFTLVLKRMPSGSLVDSVSSIVGESFFDFISKKRDAVIKPRLKIRKKKLNVPTGENISAEDTEAQTTLA